MSYFDLDYDNDDDDLAFIVFVGLVFCFTGVSDFCFVSLCKHDFLNVLSFVFLFFLFLLFVCSHC